MKASVRFFIGAAAAALMSFSAICASAQTNALPGESSQAAETRAEKIRADCIQGRRLICGKILKVLPEGLVVESGYTDLQRPALESSWLIAGNVSSHRSSDLVESAVPGSPCIGTVFLTDLPRLKRGSPRPKAFDYVVLLGYPAGQHTYNSVGSVQKTVRCFSATLAKAVAVNYKTSSN